MAEPSQEVPTDPALKPSGAAGEDPAQPSKKGAKKAEAKAKKEAEKARKAAEREAEKAASSAAAAEDLAKDNYGEITHPTKVNAERGHLRELGEAHVGKTIELQAWIQNVRMQGAKMAFLELREEGNWTIQGVVAASAEGNPVSKQMVKWIGGLKLESFVTVEAVVQKPQEPVKSAKVSGYELHITKTYLIAPAPEMLGLGLAAASRAVGKMDDEEATEAIEGLLPVALYYIAISSPDIGLSITEGTPQASLATHLNYPALHKRAPISQAIADIRIEVEELFREYLRARRFKNFHPPSLIGAASEGGANVFKLPYFEKFAYLAQSPQFYKQMEIAGGRKRVFCVGPIFRAENSNTPRHMTEVCLQVKLLSCANHSLVHRSRS
jgi:aspartyl/asparaginyl-tRNA synthetase